MRSYGKMPQNNYHVFDFSTRKEMLKYLKTLQYVAYTSGTIKAAETLRNVGGYVHNPGQPWHVHIELG